MLNKCKLIQPEYMPITEVVDYKDKKFIVVWAPGGSVRPYSSPKTMVKDSKERIYYIRKMASTVAPTEEEKRDLYNLSNNIPFDDRVNHEANMEDLNITLIQNYLKEVGSSLYEASKKVDFVDLCKSMNIISSLPEYTKPKNVGLMFFCLNPERFFPYAQIEIVSHPGADRSISLEGLKTYKVFNRRYRNRRIGEFLKEMHLTEGRNTGFRKILNALENNGSPKPIFYTDEDRLSFITTLLIHPEFENDRVNDRVNHSMSSMTKREKEVYETIIDNTSLSVSNIAKYLDISDSTVNRAIRGLKSKKYIDREGSDKTGKWIILK